MILAIVVTVIAAIVIGTWHPEHRSASDELEGDRLIQSMRVTGIESGSR